MRETPRRLRLFLLFLLLLTGAAGCDLLTGGDDDDDTGRMQIVVELTGDIEEEWRISAGAADFTQDALAVEASFAARPAWDFSYLFADAIDGGGGRSVMLAWPGALQVVTRPVTAGIPADLDDEGVLLSLDDALAILSWWEDGGSAGRETFVLVPGGGGTLEIVEATAAGGTLLQPTGEVRGTATFAAEVFQVEGVGSNGTDTLTATGQSVDVAITFTLPAWLYRGGVLEATASGGPYATPLELQGWALSGVFPVGPGYPVLTVGARSNLTAEPLLFEIQVGDPAVATFAAIDTFPTSGDGAASGARWLAYGEPAGPDAFATAGAVTVDRYELPVAEEWGISEGSFDLTMQQSGDSAFTVTGTFSAPLAPHAVSFAPAPSFRPRLRRDPPG